MPATPAYPTATKYLFPVTALFCMVFALVFVVSMLVTCWPGPYNDYWADIWTLHHALTEGIHLPELITAHNNAHRILIPRLLFILDYQWFQGSNLLILLVGLACKTMLLALLNIIIRHQSLTTRLLLNLVFFAALLNTNNLYNILYSSNIQWDLMLVFSLLAIYCHTRAMDKHPAQLCWLVTAYGCMVLGVLSHAGTLAVLPVFGLMALLLHRTRLLVLSLVMTLSVLYGTFYVLPVSDPGEPTYQPALMMLLSGPATVVYFFFNLLDSGLYSFVGKISYYFSAWLLMLLLCSLYFIRRTQTVSQNTFLLFAIFAVLAMIEIAAARSTFTPKHWGSSRFHGISLLFIAAISTHVFLSAGMLFRKNIVRILQGLTLLHALLILLLVQYFSYHDAFGLSNKIFRAHAYMFSHHRNQFDGDKIVTFFNERDRVAGIDPFFVAHDLAYYANKQDQHSSHTILGALDSQFVAANNMSALAQHCLPLTGELHSAADEEGKHLAIDWQLHHPVTDLLRIVFFRNTYYLLDPNGKVSGFVYLYLDPQQPWKSPEIRGFASSTQGKYLVEIEDGSPRCLYSLNTVL